MKSHIDWREEQSITRFKTVRLTAIRNRRKRTISTSCGLRLLQMVSEPDTGRCANEDAGPPNGGGL